MQHAILLARCPVHPTPVSVKADEATVSTRVVQTSMHVHVSAWHWQRRVYADRISPDFIFHSGLVLTASLACRPPAPNPAQPAPQGPDTGGLIAGEAQTEAEAHERMAAASGWDPDYPQRRLVQMAYSSLFVHPSSAVATTQASDAMKT